MGFKKGSRNTLHSQFVWQFDLFKVFITFKLIHQDNYNQRSGSMLSLDPDTAAQNRGKFLYMLMASPKFCWKKTVLRMLELKKCLKIWPFSNLRFWIFFKNPSEMNSSHPFNLFWYPKFHMWFFSSYGFYGGGGPKNVLKTFNEI